MTSPEPCLTQPASWALALITDDLPARDTGRRFPTEPGAQAYAATLMARMPAIKAYLVVGSEDPPNEFEPPDYGCMFCAGRVRYTPGKGWRHDGGGLHLRRCRGCGWEGSGSPDPKLCPVCGSKRLSDLHHAAPKGDPS